MGVCVCVCVCVYVCVCLSVFLSVCPSVRPSAWINSAPTERIFTNFDICGLLENTLRKFKIFKTDNNKRVFYMNIYKHLR